MAQGARDGKAFLNVGLVGGLVTLEVGGIIKRLGAEFAVVGVVAVDH